MAEKCIGKFSIKTITTDNNLCKTIVWVFDNGIIKINILILSDEKHIFQHKKIYTKFGKSLFVKAVGFKYPTLTNIHYNVSKILVDNKVSPDNIIY